MWHRAEMWFLGRTATCKVQKTFFEKPQTNDRLFSLSIFSKFSYTLQATVAWAGTVLRSRQKCFFKETGTLNFRTIRKFYIKKVNVVYNIFNLYFSTNLSIAQDDVKYDKVIFMVFRKPRMK